MSYIVGTGLQQAKEDSLKMETTVAAAAKCEIMKNEATIRAAAEIKGSCLHATEIESLLGGDC